MGVANYNIIERVAEMDIKKQKNFKIWYVHKDMCSELGVPGCIDDMAILDYLTGLK